MSTNNLFTAVSRESREGGFSFTRRGGKPLLLPDDRVPRRMDEMAPGCVGELGGG